MIRTIQNLIKSAYVSLTNDDTTSYPTAQASYKGKAATFVRLSPYGLDSNPPKDSFVLLLSAYGQESNKFGIASDMINRRVSLKEGEVAIYNTTNGSSILLKADGEIEITASSVKIASSDVDIDGIKWQTHVHTDPQGGKTGPPEDPV
jgi:phage gp45-like